MKLGWTLVSVLGLVLVVGTAVLFFVPGKNDVVKRNEAVHTLPMNLTSPDFEDGGMLPRRYTCDGKGIPPPLIIAGVPERAASLVLIVDDPDAPGGLFTHWIVWNMPTTTPYIAHLEDEPALPAGAIEGMTDFGSRGYGGPCPPSGIHRYIFHLYALDTTLDLPNDAERADLDKAIEKHIIEKAELMGRYSRDNTKHQTGLRTPRA